MSIISSRYYVFNKVIRYKASELLVGIGFVFFVASNIIELSILFFEDYNRTSTGTIFIKLLRYLAYLMFLLKILYFDKYKDFDFLKIFLVIAILLINFVKIGNQTLIFYLFVVIATKDVNPNRIISAFVNTVVVLVFSIVLLSQLGLIQDIVGDKLHRARHYLGFSWTTTAPILFLFAVWGIIYLRKGYLSIFASLAILLVSTFFYVMTNTRFSYLISIVTVVLFLVLKYFSFWIRFVKKIKGLFILFPEICALISLVLCYLYNENNKWWYLVNKILSGRLYLGKRAINTYGIHAFGNKIVWVGFELDGSIKGEYNYVDCSYLNILMQYGIVILLLILVGYSVLIYFSIQNKKIYLTWLLVLMLLFSIFEPRLLNFSFNPFFLILLPEIYVWKSTKRKEKQEDILPEDRIM